MESLTHGCFSKKASGFREGVMDGLIALSRQKSLSWNIPA
jgi:hypothetical protein